MLFGSCFNPPVYVVDQSNQKFCSHISDETFCNDINRYCETNLNNAKNGSKRINCTDLASYKGRMYCNYDAKKNKCGPIPLEDMVFSQFTGILMTSFFWCVAYIVYKQWWLGGEPWCVREMGDRLYQKGHCTIRTKCKMSLLAKSILQRWRSFEDLPVTPELTLPTAYCRGGSQLFG